MRKQRKLEMKKRRDRIEQLKEELSKIKVDHENVETELGMLHKDREVIDLKFKSESRSFKVYNEMLEAIDNEGNQELPDKVEGDEKSEDEEENKIRLQSKKILIMIQKEQ